jgi:putative PIN family toxin of toxin-antitoxin system
MEPAKILKPRWVLDTNVVLDCLVFRDPASRDLLAAIESNRLEVLAHPLTLEELRRVLAYPQCRLDGAAQQEIGDRYAALTTLVETPDGFTRNRLSLPPEFPRCRDQDDDLFLALAYHSRADALISKDRDLLKMRRKVKKFGVTILSLAGIRELW